MHDDNHIVFGFDYGRKRIGVAIGQCLTQSATPLDQIHVQQGQVDWPHIIRLIDEWQPDRLIIGLPYNMDDSESNMAKAARRFATALGQHVSLPIELIDERLSTREAKQRLASQDKQRYHKKALNSMAAVVILETWLRQ